MNYLTKEIEGTSKFQETLEYGEITQAKLHPNGTYLVVGFKKVI